MKKKLLVIMGSVAIAAVLLVLSLPMILHRLGLHPTYEGETYELPDSDELDLGPMLVEQATLALPLAPLCDSDCPGPAPDSFPASLASEAEGSPDDEADRRDPRWAALDELTFDE